MRRDRRQGKGKRSNHRLLLIVIIVLVIIIIIVIADNFVVALLLEFNAGNLPPPLPTFRSLCLFQRSRFSTLVLFYLTGKRVYFVTLKHTYARKKKRKEDIYDTK